MKTKIAKSTKYGNNVLTESVLNAARINVAIYFINAPRSSNALRKFARISSKTNNPYVNQFQTVSTTIKIISKGVFYNHACITKKKENE
jgi:hypothetical protein